MRSLSIPTLALSMALGAGLAGTVGAQEADDHGWGALLADEHEDEAPSAVLPLLAHTVSAEGPRLGVKVRDTADGLQVTEVEKGTLAGSAGVQADDLVLRIGEVRIETVADVKRALEDFGPGDEVPISVVREGEGIVKLEGKLPGPHEHEGETDDNVFFRGPAGGAFLGVTMAEADDGIHIEEVVPESSAWFAGLDSGDVITSIDGDELSSPGQLADAVSSRDVGAFVKLGFERDGKQHTVRARLGSKRPRVQVFGRGPAQLGNPHHPGMGIFPGRSLAVPGNLRIEMDDLMNDEHLEKLHEHLQQLRDIDIDMDGGQFRMHMPKGAFKLDLDALGDMGNVHEWIQTFDGGGGTSLKIRIEDGVMTIDKDGEVETYSLDEVDDGNAFEWSSSPRSRDSEDA